MFLRGGAGLAVAFAFVFIVLFSVPPAAAQAGCTDFNDPSGDLTRAPAGAPPAPADSVTGFGKADLTTGCLVETATTIEVSINTVTPPATGTQQSFLYTFVFKNGTATTTYTLTEANVATPAGSGSTTSTGVKFIINKASAGARPGSLLFDFAVSSRGQFVTPSTVFTATDRAPNDPGFVFPSTAPYQVGTRAPETLDSDSDGVPDRSELANGTDPNSPDSDNDGLLDGASRAEPSGSANATNLSAMRIHVLSDDGTTITFAGEADFGTNATDPDSDGDGLLDGPNVRAPIGGNVSASFADEGLTPISSDGTDELFLGEIEYGSDPMNPDTDADGLTDREEVTGSENSAYADAAFFPEFPGSTDPNNADSDGDGLSDAEELAGEATSQGVTRTFKPLDPNDEDTDLDGLTDFEEVFGRADIEGREVVFEPTDPTNPDTDGDGATDYDEVRGNSDPNDAGDTPAQDDQPGGAEASYLVLSTIAMLVVILLCVIGILVRWG